MTIFPLSGVTQLRDPEAGLSTKVYSACAER